jgi:hypothetical protein
MRVLKVDLGRPLALSKESGADFISSTIHSSSCFQISKCFVLQRGCIRRHRFALKLHFAATANTSHQSVHTGALQPLTRLTSLVGLKPTVAALCGRQH